MRARASARLGRVGQIPIAPLPVATHHAGQIEREARQTPGANEALIKISGEIAPDGKQGTLPLDTIVKAGVPISVIWGTEDTIIPVSHALAVKDMMDVHIVDGMGHMPDAEAPELLERLLRERLGA